MDGIVLPGGESTAMGLIGTSSSSNSSSNNNTDKNNNKTMWHCLQEFSQDKPTWGTCAGMILLAEKCIGTSAVIQDGQALIGGMDITVCRNYFGSQVSSFEMSIPPPPLPSSSSSTSSLSTTQFTTTTNNGKNNNNDNNNKKNNNTETDDTKRPFPGVFIRAPAILSAGPQVQVLGTVMATPCHQAALVLQELQKRIEHGENVIQMGVVDSLERKEGGGIQYKQVVMMMKPTTTTTTTTTADSGSITTRNNNSTQGQGQKDQLLESENDVIRLPGASNGTNAREVICAVQHDNLLCTAFHPELTGDLRWHEYFVNEMVVKQQ